MRRLAGPAVPWGLALALCLSALPPRPGAQTTSCQVRGEIHVCVAEGFAPIVNNDLSQARDEAIADAQRKALEQVSGVWIDAETITRNRMLFDELVRTKTRGVVQNTNVLESGKTADGEFRVKLEAWVKAADVQERLPDLVSELSLVVLVPEQNGGQPQAQAVVENEIVTKLTDAGYRVLDPAQLQRIARRDQLAARLRGDERTARELGLKFLSNLIIVGEATAQPSQSTAGIVSAHARVTARIIEAETGQIIHGGNVSLLQIRGFAQNATTAGERALANAAVPAAERLVQALDSYFKKRERRVEVRIKGLPSLDEYRASKAFLEKLRWVSGATEGGYSRDESLVVLTYPEKILFLAARIREEKRYRLLEFDRNRILIEYRS
jgi:hypothetical protein